MNPSVTRDLGALIALGDAWHGAGTLSDNALGVLSAHLERVKPSHTAETGAGRSTVLFSWYSSHHTVYALDWGGSVEKALAHPMAIRERIHWVDGPTQVTLQQEAALEPLDIVLLDGPHGFPFPHLEYFFFYPRMPPGALLVVDDIQIRSIRDLFNWLRADAMWEHLETVDKTAFLRRTTAPAIDPHSDSWWLQGYNQRHGLRRVVRSLVPQRVVDVVRRRRSRS